MNCIKKNGLWMVFVISLIATLGSLYYGRYGDPVANWVSGEWFNPENALTPCVLCWYARILMYPLVIVSLTALIMNKKDAVDYILPFAVLGTLLEIYQYAQIWIPRIRGACSWDVPCFVPSVNYFGFVTISFLCLIAFLMILVIALLMKKAK